MNSRPLSVSVISWILIGSAAVSAVALPLALRDPSLQDNLVQSLLPVNVQYALMAVGLLVTIAAGVLMLKGKAIGRLLYLGWGTLGLLVGFATSPFKLALIPSAVVLALFAFFLFRPKANAFFK